MLKLLESSTENNSNGVNGEIALARALYIAENEEDKMNAIEKRMNARAKVDALSQRLMEIISRV